jgi:hypothetical protein
MFWKEGVMPFSGICSEELALSVAAHAHCPYGAHSLVVGCSKNESAVDLNHIVESIFSLHIVAAFIFSTF